MGPDQLVTSSRTAACYSGCVASISSVHNSASAVVSFPSAAALASFPASSSDNRSVVVSSSCRRRDSMMSSKSASILRPSFHASCGADIEEAGERDADETRTWSGTASPAALWKTVAAATAMLKLALAMISAAFQTTPFSMSMQLCPNATMSLHSPSIFNVVSSITDRVLHHQQQAGATMQRWRAHSSPSAMTRPLPNMGMRS
uniref:Uncharacterized protein n=1 Tax=Oryza meridionalis TaxID=40149 RepID=A0A0E0DSR4_9ORYZ